VLVHGLEDLSLRPLAAALNTSARMLLYHFGSREDLIRALVMSLRRQEDIRIRDWWKEGGRQRSLPAFVRWYWRRLTSRYATPAGRLLFEVYAMALKDRHRFPGVLEGPVAYWKRLARRAGESPKTADAKATFALATMRGLLLDRIASGDERRLREAVAMLARSLKREKARPA
jgi:AcrR family transcriptional regulator